MSNIPLSGGDRQRQQGKQIGREVEEGSGKSWVDKLRIISQAFT
jgi:hypothetical protein